MLVSQKKQIDYVLSVSDKLKAVQKLNDYYRATIADKSSVMRFVSCFRDYAISCGTKQEYIDIRNNKNMLYCRLAQNNTLKTAVNTINEYNRKAEAYLRAYNNIFKINSNEFECDENIISYQNFCRIETRFLKENFQLPILNFSIHMSICYSDVYDMRNYEFHASISQAELMHIYDIRDCEFNGVDIDSALDNNINIKGCYVLFNKTIKKFYIGYSNNVYDTLKSTFTDNNSELYAEKFNGCEFFVHTVEMADTSAKNINDTINYLSWCYCNSSDTVITTLTPVKSRKLA